MHGVVLLMLEQVVSESVGEDGWDDLLEGAGVDGVFTAAGRYDDDLVHRILGGPDASRFRWFGERVVPHLAARYPGSFAAHRTTGAFLDSANHLLHDEVHKLYPSSPVPVLDVHRDPADPRWVALGHHGSVGTCAFLEGLVTGVARHYGESVRVSQPKCAGTGSASCLVLCDFGDPGGPGGCRDERPDLPASAGPCWSRIQRLEARVLRERLRRHEAELLVEHFTRDALRDPVTRLATRALLVDRLALALEQARRRQGHVGLLLLDLDDFASVNARLGPAGGDEVLRTIGGRLADLVRTGDTVARPAGDEFAVLLAPSTTPTT